MAYQWFSTSNTSFDFEVELEVGSCSNVIGALGSAYPAANYPNQIVKVLAFEAGDPPLVCTGPIGGFYYFISQDDTPPPPPPPSFSPSFTPSFSPSFSPSFTPPPPPPPPPTTITNLRINENTPSQVNVVVGGTTYTDINEVQVVVGNNPAVTVYKK